MGKRSITTSKMVKQANSNRKRSRFNNHSDLASRDRRTQTIDFFADLQTACNIYQVMLFFIIF